MVDNAATITLHNEVLYNISSVAVVSNGDQILNLIQPGVPDSSIITLTKEQIDALGLQLENNCETESQINSISEDIDETTVVISGSKRNALNILSLNVQDENELPDSPTTKYESVLKSSHKQQASSNEENIKNSVLVGANRVVYRILHPEDLRLQVPLKHVKRGRPKKQSIDPNEVMKNVDKEDVGNIMLKPVRTRSGRVTRPPRHIQGDLKKIVQVGISREIVRKQVKTKPLLNKQKFVRSVKKQELVALQPAKIQTQPIQLQTVQPETLQPVPAKTESVKGLVKPSFPPPKRKLPSKYRCTTCKKLYLGRSRMTRHLQLNPGHVAPSRDEPNDQLWSELLKRTRCAPKSEQATIFIAELSNVLQKIKHFVPNMLKPATKEETGCCHVDNILAMALGVPEGDYILNVNGILNEADYFGPQNVEQNCFESENSVQTSLLNLLDTGQVSFDSADSASATEEVMSVDQLVNERLKTLTDVELEALPNSSQNITLDLSLDMFSYHTG